MLTTAQAAAILGVTDSQVRRLIGLGKLKATRLGPRMWMIKERDLEAYRKTPPPHMGRPRKDSQASPVPPGRAETP